MAANRKLQGEIDRCLKKVTEGVEKFEETWQKVHNASNANQKEKYEEDLKKEIKKLQRLRDQIKTWIASGSINDKTVLLEKRKLIEQQMERFKVVERETKTKAYSKEGLTSGTKMDPAERERCEVMQWLNECLEKLNIQMDQFEAEIETLGGASKKKRRGGNSENADAIEEFNQLLAKHRDHVQKLETLLRMLDNDTVNINQIKDIKEDVEYYIEQCQEPDFAENEMIYDDIEGLDEMLLDVSNNFREKSAGGGNDNNTNSVSETSETMSTNSANSPVPYSHNHSSENEAKRRHKSSSEEAKSKNASSSIAASSNLSSSSAPKHLHQQHSTSSTATPSSSTIAASSSSGGGATNNNHHHHSHHHSAISASAHPAAAASAASAASVVATAAAAAAASNSQHLSSSSSSSHPGTPPASSQQQQQSRGGVNSAKLTLNTGLASSVAASSTPNNSSPSSGPPGESGGGGMNNHHLLSSSSSTASQSLRSAPVLTSSAGSHQPNFAAAVQQQQVNGHVSQLEMGLLKGNSSNNNRNNSSPLTVMIGGNATTAAVAGNGGGVAPTSSSAGAGGNFSNLINNSSSSVAATSAADGLPSLKSMAQEALSTQQLQQQLQERASPAGSAAGLASAAPGGPVGIAAGLLGKDSRGGSSSLVVSQQQGATPGSGGASQPPSAAAGVVNASTVSPSAGTGSAATGEANISPLLGVAPLGPVPLNSETRFQYKMLEAAFQHMPHPSDSERLRPYLPRNPCPTPPYYPQLPPPTSDTLDFFQRLSTETLFFIFYYMEGTKAQYLAAKALKKQSWRFHTKYMMWFQRHEEPKIINDEYEQGTYIYFDFEKWGQRRKEGFTFEYRFLEDRDLS